MRICGGKFRGRKLFTPDSDHIRPTSDKVRLALFNMLDSRGLINNQIILDGFCGTGALGLEAISRGAEHCIFIDKDRRSIKNCTKNIEMLQAEEASTTICKDTSRLGNKGDDQPKAQCIFLDPPYNKDLIPQAITALENGNWTSDDAVYVLESEKRFTLNNTTDNISFSLLQEKIYKDTKIMIIQKRINS